MNKIKNKKIIKIPFKLNLKYKNFINSLSFFKLNLKYFIVTNTHLGYESKRWNPVMKTFIFGIRNKMHVLDIQITLLLLRKIFFFSSLLIKLRKSILFSSENKHIDHILKKVILTQKQHISCNRWIGGILSNFKEIKKNITMLNTRYLQKKRFKLLSNRRKKLKLALEGMFLLNHVPAFLIIMNGSKSKWALNESMRMNIPVSSVLDSNTFKFSNFPIIGNNSGFSSQILFIKFFQILLKITKLKEILLFKNIKRKKLLIDLKKRIKFKKKKRI